MNLGAASRWLFNDTAVASFPELIEGHSCTT
jgi:hypothetical protein